MVLRNWRVLLPFVTPALVFGGILLAVSFPQSAASTRAPADVYHIYAGSTHAHTQLTWSHGDQWMPNSPGAKKAGLKVSPEGVQSPPATGVLKPEWRQHQGTPADHFARAKARQFDFYITTDHSQEELLNPPSDDNPAWVGAHQQARAATDASFVGLVGYEHSENNGPGGSGHINVINSAGYLNALAPGVDLPTLYQWLQRVPSAGDGPVVATFNHPNPKQYNEWGYRDAGVTDVITMLELINSNKNLHYEGFLAALDMGWKVSPVAGNDNHGFAGIERHTSRTFVLATSKTKVAILEAMKHRRTYASLEQNLQCRYTVNGAIMGSTLDRPDTLVFDISVRDPDTAEPKDMITKIDIVTDGGSIAATYEPAPGHEVAWKPTIRNTTNKYFFVRIWNAGGGDLTLAQSDQPVAWLAPVWTGR